MGLRLIISRIRAWREKPPTMIGVPPSARQIPADAGLHALDFSHRYAEPMDDFVEQRMIELGIPDQQIGARVPFQGKRHAAFVPHEKTGGGNEPGGKLVVDSGVFNTDLLMKDYGQGAGERSGAQGGAADGAPDQPTRTRNPAGDGEGLEGEIVPRLRAWDPGGRIIAPDRAASSSPNR